MRPASGTRRTESGRRAGRSCRPIAGRDLPVRAHGLRAAAHTRHCACGSPDRDPVRLCAWGVPAARSSPHGPRFTALNKHVHHVRSSAQVSSVKIPHENSRNLRPLLINCCGVGRQRAWSGTAAYSPYSMCDMCRACAPGFLSVDLGERPPSVSQTRTETAVFGGCTSLLRL